MNKKKLSSILLGFLILPSLVSAQLFRPPSPVSPAMFIINVLKSIWIIFIAIVVISFVISGILFLTAQGQAEKLKTAKAAFLWGIAGIVVGILAYSITLIIENALLTTP